MNTVLNFDLLKDYLAPILHCAADTLQVNQRPGSYSDLSFLVESATEKFILRRPPFGEKIAKAHDMSRVVKVLEGLKKAGYTKSPLSIHYCAEESIFGAPFFIMEFIEGVILRNRVPQGIPLDKEAFTDLSR